MGFTHSRRSRRALAAAAMLGMVGGSLATMGTANAAVMVSGSLIDSTGNYVEGVVYAYTTTGVQVGSDFTYNGAFDIPLDDGTYKLEFNSFGDFQDEWYRDKADEATADVVTVAGAAQTLAPWTVDRAPQRDGRRPHRGRPPGCRGLGRSPTTPPPATCVDSTTDRRIGCVPLGTTTASVKLLFSGYRPARPASRSPPSGYNDKATRSRPPTPSRPPRPAPTSASSPWCPAAPSPVASPTSSVRPLHRAQVCADSSSNCDETDPNGYYLIEGVNTGDSDRPLHRPHR